jgi:FkbM family methyltransferase
MQDKTLNSLKTFNNLRKNPALGFLRKVIPAPLKRAISGYYGISTAGVGSANLYPIALSNGTTVKIPSDQYWSYYMDDIGSYEPEMKQIIDLFANEDSLFIDGGANIGLWSVYTSGIIKNANQVVAVEPTDIILKILKQNQELNNNNFSIIPKAIWHKSGEILEFKLYHSHAANSLKDNTTAEGTEREVIGTLKMETIALDDIITNAKEKQPNINNIIVKLDVEGVEIEALDGMKNALANEDIIIIYEDHAKEITSETTNHILNTLKMNIYYISEEETDRAIRIQNLEQVKDIKVNKGKGYNFIACVPGKGFDGKMAGMVK